MKFLTISFALLTAFTSCTSSCKYRPKQDNIQSGNLELTNSVNFKDTCYSVPIQFDISKQSVFKSTASVLNMEGFASRSGNDFSVKTRKRANSNSLSIYLFSASRTWQKITISYLMTSRDDLLLGSFIADTFSACGCETQPDKLIIQQPIGNLGSLANNKINTQVYLSGMRTLKQSPIFKISQEKIDNRTGIISFRLDTDTTSVENIQISYVVYKQDSFQIKIYNPINFNDVDGYILAGSYGYSKNKLIVQFLSILTQRINCNGWGCSTKCIIKRQCYGTNTIILAGGDCLMCGKGQKITDKGCVSNCGPKMQIDRGNCVCIAGMVPVGNTCMPQCAQNQYYNQDNKCECKPGFARLGSSCKQCPVNSKWSNGKCICMTSDYRWDDLKQCCIKPPIIVIPPILPITPSIKCPPRSQWVQSSLTCACTYPDQHMINNQCNKCLNGQLWNGKQCICSSGQYRIKGGMCRSCDINGNYDGQDCVCNWGFYPGVDKCEKCHNTCGKCSGPGANHCIQCAQASFNLKDGYCTKSTPCLSNQYLDNGCQDCPAYCSSCSSLSNCTSCIDGWKLKNTVLAGQSVAFCEQICGDGKRFQDQCDDGNLVNGDGCSSTCKVQKGFTCQGGTTVKASLCTKCAPRSIINATKAATFFGKVMQGIRMTNIPAELAANDCQQCYKLLTVKVISSPVVPSVQLRFIPKSQYQFYCQFDFYGLLAIPVFSISIQISPQYTHYFSAEDAAQIQIRQIDPALLAKIDEQDTLTLDDIDPASTGNSKVQKFFIDHAE